MQNVAMEEIVRGDRVKVKEGDKFPADMVLIEICSRDGMKIGRRIL